MFFLFCLFVISVISRFGFEGSIWVLIASVPDLCKSVCLRKLVVCKSPQRRVSTELHRLSESLNIAYRNLFWLVHFISHSVIFPHVHIIVTLNTRE